MLHLAIVEDKKPQAEHLYALVMDWAALRRVVLSVQIFQSGESFQFNWPEQYHFDVLLLDVGLGGINGIDLAKTIRSQDQQLIIIFITGLEDHMQEGYEVSALHYLLKPVNRDKLFACLDRALKQTGRESASIILTNERGEQVRLPQEEIMAAEAFAHTVCIHTTQTTLEVRLSIGELEKALMNNLFIRCHRGYLVGLAHIARINREALVLDDGRAVPISRRLYPAVNRAFITFHRREGE